MARPGEFLPVILPWPLLKAYPGRLSADGGALSPKAPVRGILAAGALGEDALPAYIHFHRVET
jgi:hypothetical protein